MLISPLSASSKFDNRGFTLIEMLVIIAVLGILSAVLIGYTKQSGQQLLVVSSQAKLVSLISRAKSLSITTFLENPTEPENLGGAKFCGYGVHIDKNVGEAFIFRDLAKTCDSGDNIYTSNSDDKKLEGNLDEFRLDSTVIKFSDDSTLENIIFVPPDPKVFINGDGGSDKEATVGIEAINHSVKKEIKVTHAGNITTTK